jgi:hypothetical protein
MNFASTHLQIADALSKKIPKPAFELHRHAMGLAFSTTPSHTKKYSVTWLGLGQPALDNELTCDVLCTSSPLLELRVCVGILYRALAG